MGKHQENEPLVRPRRRWRNHITRIAMYLQRNIKVRSCNHYCGGKAISITYYECVLVTPGIQDAMRMRHIVICALPDSIFFHDFRGGKKVTEHKMCFDFFYKLCPKNFSFEKELSETISKICIGLNVKHPFFLSDFNKTSIFSTDFLKILKYNT